MPVQVIIAKNVTPNPVELSRLGVTVLGNSQVTLSDFYRTEELWEATDLSDAVTAGIIVINDGSGDLAIAPGLRWISPPLASSDVDAELDNSSSTPTPDVLVRFDSNGQLLLKETSDPTNLIFGTVPNNSYLKRDGNEIVGAVLLVDEGVVGPASATDSAIALFNGTTGKVLKNSTTADGSIAVVGSDVRVGVLATDAQHGVRGGGAQHALATTSVAGFLSAADKVKVEGLPAGGASVRQSVFSSIEVDTTTGSTTYVTLISQTITITAGGIVSVAIAGSVSNSTSNATTNLKLEVNGVQQAVSQIKSQGGNVTAAIAMLARVEGLAPGTYTVLVTWKVTSGTGQIRPVTLPEGECLNMLITEVTA